MKHLLLSAVVVGAALPALAQQPDCRSVHNGTFEMVGDNVPRTHITRTGNRQTEQLENSDQLTDYLVNWLNDCTYELVPQASFFVKYPAAPRTARLRVRITSVSARGYSIETSSNFFPGVMRGEVLRRP